MRRTALAALCITAVATFSLTGCLSGEDKADGPFAGLTGGEIADKAVKATSEADSLRMKGEIQDESAGGTVQMDMAMNKKGDCAGTMSMGGDGEAELIKVGDTLYMKYDEAFLRAQSKDSSKEEADMVVDMLAGKWTKTSAAAEDSKDIASFCDLDTVLADFEDVNSDATRGKTAEVEGTPAIVLSEKDGKDSYTLYVATKGEPYLLRVVSKSAKEPGDLVFTDYDKPVPAEAPKGKVIDLDKDFG
ncbi:hypothetical protein PV728_30185 [Streptomyces europaeiscabiei]|uniref:hypothetical protein n=1 Tax=Streptomyces europaeiscabiei TaxID=146819 RepID=UPI0029A8B691|nr:hypothetical protein [Streptomyces europaeiscabiei]MDX3634463.1 hypothetical protein [Streptomyces europaeiscabiei]MDX3653381.1 hypothetical protein [Streptomyces europaeiscabiei]